MDILNYVNSHRILIIQIRRNIESCHEKYSKFMILCTISLRKPMANTKIFVTKKKQQKKEGNYRAWLQSTVHIRLKGVAIQHCPYLWGSNDRKAFIADMKISNEILSIIRSRNIFTGWHTHGKLQPNLATTTSQTIDCLLALDCNINTKRRRIFY